MISLRFYETKTLKCYQIVPGKVNTALDKGNQMTMVRVGSLSHAFSRRWKKSKL